MKWFIDVSVLNAGQSFGELALINNEKRQATIKCDKDCLFAVINQAEYEKVLKKIDSRDISKKIDFFIKMPFLKHWTLTQIKKLIPSFGVMNIQRNQVVFN